MSSNNLYIRVYSITMIVFILMPYIVIQKPIENLLQLFCRALAVIPLELISIVTVRIHLLYFLKTKRMMQAGYTFLRWSTLK